MTIVGASYQTILNRLMLQSCQLCDVAHDFRYDPCTNTKSGCQIVSGLVLCIFPYRLSCLGSILSNESDSRARSWPHTFLKMKDYETWSCIYSPSYTSISCWIEDEYDFASRCLFLLFWIQMLFSVPCWVSDKCDRNNTKFSNSFCT